MTSYDEGSGIAPAYTSIDEHAPVKAATAADIAAGIETVWSLLTTLDRWPAWNPDVRDVALRGPVAPGTTFRWRSGPSVIVSTIRTVEEPRFISWTGRTLGIKAVHVWWLEAKDGHTRVVTEESWSGILPRLFRKRLSSTLLASLERGLGYLRSEAERRALHKTAA